MIKKDELTNPQSCMSRARDNEMTFVLLARDKAAPAAIRAWAAERLRIGKNTFADAQILDALDCANEMELQREKMDNAADVRREPIINCVIPGCICVGAPQPGFTFFVCDRCLSQLQTLLESEWRHRNLRSPAR